MNPLSPHAMRHPGPLRSRIRSIRHEWKAWPILAALALAGCGDSRSPEATALDPGATSQKSRVLGYGAPAQDQPVVSRNRPSGPNVAENILQEIPGGAVAKSVRADRKIIYTATVDLVTDDLNKVEPKLLALVAEAGGFVAETDQTGSIGGQRSATWRIRVPVDTYDGFLQKTRTLGEVRSVRVASQDVTEEFVDVTARVNAKKVQEQRLIELIKNATANLEDVLKVEGELARVRAEIERMEGRLRFLKDQTDLTTVTVTVTEIKNYVPPEAPTFGTKIRRNWTESTTRVQQNLGDFVLALVSWTPFLPFYVAGWGLFIWLLSRGFRKIRPLLLAEYEHVIRPAPIDAAAKRDEDPTEPT